MKILFAFFAIFTILFQTHSVLSLNPTCAFYDFNDPLILREFNDCTLTGARPLRIESYSDSTFSPFREDSQYFLTTNKSVHSDITQCISTKVQFRGNFSSLSVKIGINLENNDYIDQNNDVQLTISNILGFKITPTTNGWMLYERDYSLPNLGAFDDAVIGLKVRIGSNSDLAVEFLKFYDRQITDEYCVPSSTSHQPEITTEVTTPERETPTQETENPTPETEAPTPETEAPTPETEAPTPETETSTTETETPTSETETSTLETGTSTTETETSTLETETPTPETETPTSETETPTSETETPTSETETPTSETETPNPETEIEVPACLEVDFNSTTSLHGTFKECEAQYLPEFIIKSYLDTTIPSYRETSLFYLSNKWEGLSCLETTSIFQLAESSFIESVIFLYGISPGAWIEISVADMHTGMREVVQSLTTENHWVGLSAKIKGNYSNAQFMIKANMNAYSELAVEYFTVRSDSC